MELEENKDNFEIEHHICQKNIQICLFENCKGQKIFCQNCQKYQKISHQDHSDNFILLLEDYIVKVNSLFYKQIYPENNNDGQLQVLQISKQLKRNSKNLTNFVKQGILKSDQNIHLYTISQKICQAMTYDYKFLQNCISLQEYVQYNPLSGSLNQKKQNVEQNKLQMNKQEQIEENVKQIIQFEQSFIYQKQKLIQSLQNEYPELYEKYSEKLNDFQNQKYKSQQQQQHQQEEDLQASSSLTETNNNEKNQPGTPTKKNNEKQYRQNFQPTTRNSDLNDNIFSYKQKLLIVKEAIVKQNFKRVADKHKVNLKLIQKWKKDIIECRRGGVYEKENSQLFNEIQLLVKDYDHTYLKRKNDYTDEEKLRILKLTTRTGCKTKTSQVFGVHLQTIRKWFEQFNIACDYEVTEEELNEMANTRNQQRPYMAEKEKICLEFEDHSGKTREFYMQRYQHYQKSRSEQNGQEEEEDEEGIDEDEEEEGIEEDDDEEVEEEEEEENSESQQKNSDQQLQNEDDNYDGEEDEEEDNEESASSIQQQQHQQQNKSVSLRRRNFRNSNNNSANKKIDEDKSDNQSQSSSSKQQEQIEENSSKNKRNYRKSKVNSSNKYKKNSNSDDDDDENNSEVNSDDSAIEDNEDNDEESDDQFLSQEIRMKQHCNQIEKEVGSSGEICTNMTVYHFNEAQEQRYSQYHNYCIFAVYRDQILIFMRKQKDHSFFLFQKFRKSQNEVRALKIIDQKLVLSTLNEIEIWNWEKATKEQNKKYDFDILDFCLIKKNNEQFIVMQQNKDYLEVIDCKTFKIKFTIKQKLQNILSDKYTKSLTSICLLDTNYSSLDKAKMVMGIQNHIIIFNLSGQYLDPITLPNKEDWAIFICRFSSEYFVVVTEFKEVLMITSKKGEIVKRKNINFDPLDMKVVTTKTESLILIARQDGIYVLKSLKLDVVIDINFHKGSLAFNSLSYFLEGRSKSKLVVPCQSTPTDIIMNNVPLSNFI